jgi:hypothetical protein
LNHRLPPGVFIGFYQLILFVFPSQYSQNGRIRRNFQEHVRGSRYIDDGL